MVSGLADRPSSVASRAAASPPSARPSERWASASSPVVWHWAAINSGHGRSRRDWRNAASMATWRRPADRGTVREIARNCTPVTHQRRGRAWIRCRSPDAVRRFEFTHAFGPWAASRSRWPCAHPAESGTDWAMTRGGIDLKRGDVAPADQAQCHTREHSLVKPFSARSAQSGSARQRPGAAVAPSSSWARGSAVAAPAAES